MSTTILSIIYSSIIFLPAIKYRNMVKDDIESADLMFIVDEIRIIIEVMLLTGLLRLLGCPINYQWISIGIILGIIMIVAFMFKKAYLEKEGKENYEDF